jgi:hypothetical protein
MYSVAIRCLVATHHLHVLHLAGIGVFTLWGIAVSASLILGGQLATVLIPAGIVFPLLIMAYGISAHSEPVKPSARSITGAMAIVALALVGGLLLLSGGIAVLVLLGGAVLSSAMGMHP